MNPALCPKANFHTHSLFCDGSDSPEDIAAYAVRNGFTHLGFSGHMDPDIHMDIEAYYRCIRALQKEYAGQIDILRGVEIDGLYPTDCLYDAEYRIGSTHFLDVDAPIPMSVDNTPQMLHDLCRGWFGGDYYALSKAYYELEANVYDRTKCTFVGHFDLIVRFNDRDHFLDESDPRYLKPALDAMEYLVSRGVPFEINCGAVNRGRKNQPYPNQTLLNALHQFGGRILITSDAHQKELLCGGFDAAVKAAKEAGFTHTNILEHSSENRVVLREIALDALRF